MRLHPLDWSLPPSLAHSLTRSLAHSLAHSRYLHFAGDAQKFFTLKYRPRALITEGLFSRSRNINYLGEMLIYSAFALVANNAWLVLANLLMWTSLFRANMMKKDASLSRYPGFAEYKERSNLLLPKVFGRGDSDDGKKL